MNTFLPPDIPLEVGRRFNWKLFGLILAACIVAVIALLPYALTLQSATLNTAKLPMPLPLLLVVQVGENALLFAITAGLGLLLAARVGLGLPFMEGWLNGQPIWNRLPRIALIAVFLGLAGGALIIVLDALIFGPPLQAQLAAFGVHIPQSANPPAWQGFLASFYGGITEETLLRLFVMSLLAWLGRFASRTADNRPTQPILWSANILAAILFGLGHLPATMGMGIPLTGLVVVRAVVLNGLVGVVTGWLYAKWGLESAMIAHFSADMVLHVITPLIAALVT